ncbi:hypothetical protein BDZ45DRAFT_809441 [Acephala macrosclerotiorum]|nr:hypothetical protein BDZ45DRAFT_809441 [Acephala macrosclerotiorum]
MTFAVFKFNTSGNSQLCITTFPERIYLSTFNSSPFNMKVFSFISAIVATTLVGNVIAAPVAGESSCTAF